MSLNYVLDEQLTEFYGIHDYEYSYNDCCINYTCNL